MLNEDTELGVLNEKTGNVEPFKSSEWRMCAYCGVPITEVNDTRTEVFVNGSTTMPVCASCEAGKETCCCGCGRNSTTGMLLQWCYDESFEEQYERDKQVAVEKYGLDKFVGWCSECGLGVPVRTFESNWPDWFLELFGKVGCSTVWDGTIPYQLYSRDMSVNEAADFYLKVVKPEQDKRMALCGHFDPYTFMDEHDSGVDYWAYCKHPLGGCSHGVDCKNAPAL